MTRQAQKTRILYVSMTMREETYERCFAQADMVADAVIRSQARRYRRFVLVAAGILVVGVECVIRLGNGAFGFPRWSMYALFPCLVIAGVLLMLNKRAQFKSELKRRFYV